MGADLSPDPVPIEDLLRSHWGLTGVTVIERLQTYSTRHVRRITSDQGRFAVKVDHGSAAAKNKAGDVQAEVAMALPRHVPMIRPDLAGAFAVVNGGLSIAVHEDIDVDHPQAPIHGAASALCLRPCTPFHWTSARSPSPFMPRSRSFTNMRPNIRSGLNSETLQDGFGASTGIRPRRFMANSISAMSCKDRMATLCSSTGTKREQAPLPSI